MAFLTNIIRVLFIAQILIARVHCYIRHDSNSGTQNFTYFTPYAKGFVGVYGEPSNFLRERINEGSFENPAKELIYEQAVKTQTCPGMVGPFTDGNYFCTAKEYGYCDRRSGVCFCNIGYQGIDCSECTPSYFKVDYLCYPKKLCPNDCNGAGVCDYWTGTCHCLPHRVGHDCGTLLCKSFNELCEACSTTQCLRCPAGYYLTDANDCRSCYDYDPRCAGCTKDLGCTLCADPILTSVRRSGYRTSDPRVPVEEDSREFSITLPFGTKSPESFADAEAFIVATTPDQPLRDNAKSCHQGYNNDENWFCEDLLASHIVCGHKGVFSFTYPNYVINETSRFFRVSVRRSGGGFGNVLVNYFIKHFTTSDNDLTATAPYTTSQTLEFDDGVVERSFLVSIIDDNIVEENEVFQIVLELPEGGGSIGAQFRTNVTIVDDDLHLLSPVFTSPTLNEIVSVAGSGFSVPVQAVAASGVALTIGGERFLAVIENDVVAWSESTKAYRSDGQRHSMRTLCEVVDGGNGTYLINGELKQQGKYQLRIWHAFPLGLTGTYHRDAFMENVALERIDRFVNFTWGEGRLLPRGADYISIRWTGVIRPDSSDDFFFRVDADDHARLWIDGNLLVDHWHEQRADLEPYRSVAMVKDFLYEVVLEYREVRGNAYARLMWTSSQNFNDVMNSNEPGIDAFVVIPPENMYSLHEIGRSPVAVIVTSSDTSAAQTECTGDGLFRAVALEVSHFRFCPRDKYRNFRDDVDAIFLASEIFNVSLILEKDDVFFGQGREVIFPELRYNTEDSCFDAVYIPDRAGNYRLDILYHTWHGETGYHVAGSPFYVNVLPNKMNGPYSSVIDIPSPFYTVAGVCYNFTIISKDGSHNLLLKGGENIQVYMSRVAFFETFAEESISTETFVPGIDMIRYGTVYDHRNGNYSVELCPTVTGWYEAHFLLSGSGVSNIPHRIKDRLLSMGEAMGLDSGSSFKGQYIDKSPYRMYTSNSHVSSGLSSVEVNGNLQRSVVGELASFVITCRDNWGNVVRNSSLNTNIVVKLLLSPDSLSQSFDLGNGSYRIEFTPQKTGENLVEVLIDGSPIKGSPFRVPVVDGIANYSYTFAKGIGLSIGRAGEISSFLVYSHDVNGNMKSGNADNFTFETFESESIRGNLMPCGGDVESAKHCGNNLPLEGVYYGTFTPTVAGDLALSIYLHDHNSRFHIRDSPFSVRIHPGAPHAESSIVSGTLHNATVGKEYFVHVHLVDIFGNKLERGGDDIELMFDGVSGDWGTIEPYGTLPGVMNKYFYSGHFGPYPEVYGMWIDHGDGSYTASFSLQTCGQYVSRLSIAEPGLNATYFNDTTFGYLVDLDDNLNEFDDSRGGDDVNTGSTMSWTGDIGRRPGARGDLAEGSYFHRFKSRVESNVNFDLRSSKDVTSGDIRNTLFSAGEKFREDYWSVRYVGLIKPGYPEKYNFTILADAESTVRILIGGTGSAALRNHPAQEVARLQPNASMAFGQYSFTDKNMREFILEYQHFTGPDTFLTVFWESPSTPKSVIPMSAFRHWRNASHYNLTANPNVLCSSCSTVYGDALSVATAGQLHTFTLYGRDAFGNLLQTGGDVPSMVAVGPNGASFRGVVDDFRNSTYRISYYPSQSGIYRMYISIGCCVPHPNVGLSREIDLLKPLLVGMAPYMLNITAAVIHGPKCIAVGSGITSGVVGILEHFKIFFRDAHGNPTSAATGVNIAVEFYIQNSNNTVDNSAANLQEIGFTSATIYYNMTRSGNYTVVVLLNGKHIVGSPFSLFLRPTIGNPGTTIVRGLGKTTAVAHKPSFFEVTVRDLYGNAVTSGGNKLYIRLIGSHRREDVMHAIIPSCLEDANGKYQCRYVASIPGNYNMRIKLLTASDHNPGGSGLLGYYYGNAERTDLNGISSELSSPLVVRLDRSIDLSYRHGFFLHELESGIRESKVYAGVDFSSGVRIIWEGYVVSPFSDEVVIKTISNKFDATVYVDDSLVYDSLVESVVTRDLRYSTSPLTTLRLDLGTVYSLRVEAWCEGADLMDGTDLFLKLVWSTSSIRENIIPAFYLYSNANEINLSPFPINIKAY